MNINVLHEFQYTANQDNVLGTAHTEIDLQKDWFVILVVFIPSPV